MIINSFLVLNESHMFTQISNHYLAVLIEESRGGKRVLAFRGIRHLQPPVI